MDGWKMRKKHEEGENSRTKKWLEMKKDPEWKGIYSRSYWSMGLGARKPMGFLGPTHDET